VPLLLLFPILAADVSNREQKEPVFEWTMPDVVIHTAAIGRVDFAERNREETRKVKIFKCAAH